MSFATIRLDGKVYLDDCWILFAALDEFVVGEFGVAVFVHVLEDLAHALEQMVSCVEHLVRHMSLLSPVYPHLGAA